MSKEWPADLDDQPVAGPSRSKVTLLSGLPPPARLRSPRSRGQLRPKQPAPRATNTFEELDHVQGFDVPESFTSTTSHNPILPQRISYKTASSPNNTTFRNLTQTVDPSYTTGSGTVTRLVVKASTKSSSVKAIAAAYDQSFEHDIEIPTSLQKLKRPLPKARLDLAPVDEFESLRFDDEDEDEDQATLKAGATFKAALPPKRDRNMDVATVKPKTPVKKAEDDASWDIDFKAGGEMPLSLSRLSLDKIGSGRLEKPGKTSESLFTSPGVRSRNVKGWEDSPGRSETDTSRTSTSSGLSLPDREKQREKEMDRAVVLDDEDMEDGLVILEPMSFTGGGGRTLNGMLDLKRKPQPEALTTASRARPGQGERGFEDGLVLINAIGEISRRKLKETIGARGPVTQARKVSGGRNAEEERAREKEREKAWGRHTPIQSIPPPRNRTHSTLSKTTPLPRSQSATTAKEMPYGEAPSRPIRPRPSADSFAMPPPPIPPHASSSRQPPTPFPSKLRHRQSQTILPAATPLPSPSIHRNRSQASLQHVDIGSSPINTIKPGKSTYSSSTSRLHDPTKSSASKTRLPFCHVFPVAGAGSPEKQGASKVEESGMTAQRSRGKGIETNGNDDVVNDGSRKTGNGVGIGKPGNRGHIPPRTISDKQRSSSRQESLPIVQEKRKREIKSERSKTKRGTISYVDPDAALETFKENNPGFRSLPKYDKITGWTGHEDVVDIFDDDPTPRTTGPSLITPDSIPLNFTRHGRTSSNTNSLDPYSTIKIVGDMKFDTERMCWVSILEDEEPDPFEGLADDEDDEGGGATITRKTGRLMEIRYGAGRMASESSISTSGGSEWGPGSREGDEVFERLRKQCRDAEKRHGEEMRSWVGRGGAGGGESEKEREKRLWDIRKLALQAK